ncbi:MAG: ParA family protein [Prevotella sp.]|nr:ParA family protein [Prevotella sp.]
MSKAKVMAIANHKGGVAKTTTAATFGAVLASMGKKVLLVDLDAQANLTQALTAFEPEMTIYDAFKDGQRIDPVVINDNLHLIPSDEEFATIDLILPGMMEREYRLKDFLSFYMGDYDYIFIDCPPTLGLLLQTALVAADGLIIPTTAEALPYKGIKMLMGSLQAVQKRLNPQVKLLAFLVTRYNGRKLNKAVQTYLHTYYPDIVLKTVIRENISIAEAPLEHKSIIEYAPTSNGAQDYTAAVKELLARMEG